MDLDIIYNDDCLEGLKSIPDNSIDLVITDPPYLISTLGGGTINKVKKLKDSLTDLTNADIAEGYDIEKFNTEFIRVSLWTSPKNSSETVPKREILF